MMKLLQQETAILIFCWLLIFFDEVVSHRRKTKKQNAGRRNRLRNSRILWLCPSVRCQPIPASCRKVETLVVRIRHQYCESCPYCIYPMIPRQKRHLGENNRRVFEDVAVTSMQWQPKPKQPCPPALRCPAHYCPHPRLTDIWISGQKCQKCPVCFHPRRKIRNRS